MRRLWIGLTFVLVCAGASAPGADALPSQVFGGLTTHPESGDTLYSLRDGLQGDGFWASGAIGGHLFRPSTTQTERFGVSAFRETYITLDGVACWTGGSLVPHPLCSGAVSVDIGPIDRFPDLAQDLGNTVVRSFTVTNVLGFINHPRAPGGRFEFAGSGSGTVTFCIRNCVHVHLAPSFPTVRLGFTADVLGLDAPEIVPEPASWLLLLGALTLVLWRHRTVTPGPMRTPGPNVVGVLAEPVTFASGCG